MKQLQGPVKTATKGLLGAFAIAGGTSSYADIIPTAPPADMSVPAGTTISTFEWDVDNNGVVDFSFDLRYPDADPSAGNGLIWQVNMNPAAGLAATNGVVSYDGAFLRYAFALTSGTTIDGAAPFSTQTQMILGSQYAYNGSANLYAGFAAGPNANGAVPPGTPAYAGFRFDQAGQALFGWVQLSVNAGSIDFIGAAFNNTPGTPIDAGAVPEPSTMAMLALGAMGVVGVAIKRRRSS